MNNGELSEACEMAILKFLRHSDLAGSLYGMAKDLGFSRRRVERSINALTKGRLIVCRAILTNRSVFYVVQRTVAGDRVFENYVLAEASIR